MLDIFKVALEYHRPLSREASTIQKFLPTLPLALPACVISVLISACGGGGGGSSTPVVSTPVSTPTTGVADCGVESQKSFVLAVAQDWYLWFDELANVDAADFASAEAYLVALTAPLAEDFRDPGFSYLTTAAEDEANFTNAAFVGFGFRFAIDDSGRYLISDAFEGAPAASAGLQRGAEILAVDSGDGFITMQDYEAQGVGLDQIFGEAEIGVERGFRIRRDGETLDLIITKDELSIPPMANAPRLLERPGLSPVAYIHLRNFTLSAEPELEAAFAELRDRSVTDFLIDLRYNGGGLVDVANRFLDLLGGIIADNNTAYEVTHNVKRASENRSYQFNNRSNSASPIRIAFITSGATASASELMINSLEPFVDVVLIGEDTTGKAVGQYAFDQRNCDTRLRIVAFESVNGEGFGGYYTGLVDTGRFTLCPVEDSYTGAFGSRDDPLTAGALAWLNEGSCAAPVNVSSTRTAAKGLPRSQTVKPSYDRPDRRSLWIQ
ncbi:MAG: S41 family peptidase [Congregibacter sp.]